MTNKIKLKSLTSKKNNKSFKQLKHYQYRPKQKNMKKVKYP
jgi:hypothetical protein